MPNWCLNAVVITGSAIELGRFWTDAQLTEGDFKDDLFAFATLVPVENGEDCVDKWGTKWNPHDGSIVQWRSTQTGTLEAIKMDYLTPWCPPTEYWMHVTAKYTIRVLQYFNKADEGVKGYEVVEGGRSAELVECEHDHNGDPAPTIMQELKQDPAFVYLCTELPQHADRRVPTLIMYSINLPSANSL